ncbi:hypothetical protein FEE95_03545 [Maribacter algarum]|uniref:Uncharacterized protein n=1 Tax=Maribacter algarum (ex Zhang et al. 2020) TaxID=2578118 RepID=A0A5S3PUD1_9FLAO|nr:hypothetical protein [Maribacter algarum]TMM58518.1 hypothetical protein FEE95_03545 [Maribacter algarum]
MKKEDVPQDESKLETANIREMYYAIDENGEYTTEVSTGWDPKTIALNNALEQIKERAEDAKIKVLNNETSPIEYYMELNKMDVPILASYAGFWQWQVKRHFKPSVFKRLNSKKLQKYADVFEISVEQLKNIKA